MRRAIDCFIHVRPPRRPDGMCAHCAGLLDEIRAMPREPMRKKQAQDAGGRTPAQGGFQAASVARAKARQNPGPRARSRKVHAAYPEASTSSSRIPQSAEGVADLQAAQP